MSSKSENPDKGNKSLTCWVSKTADIAGKMRPIPSVSRILFSSSSNIFVHFTDYYLNGVNGQISLWEGYILGSIMVFTLVSPKYISKERLLINI